jgi:predicted RNA binding protein YcfA (HicA-like mRNA interferase family)
MASLVVKPKQLIKALKKAGFYIHHQSGSHARLLHKTRPNLRVTVPIHSKDIPKGTLFRILKQANLTKEEFIDLM